MPIKKIIENRLLLNKLIIESMSDGIYTIDNNRVCTFINESALRMLGYTREQCIGKSMHELVHNKYPSGADYPESDCPICKTFYSREGNTVDDEVFWKSDGGQLHVRYTSNPVFDNNELIGVLVLISDISDLKKKEAEIIKIKNNQDNLLNATEDFIWSVDTERRLITFNKAYADRISSTTGRPVKEGELAIEKEFGVEIVTKWEGYYNKALSGASFKITEQISDPVLKSVEYDLISFVPMYNGAKEVYGVACSAKDITEEVNSRKSLADAYSDLENIFNQSMDIICTIDKEGRFIEVSAASKKIWGYSPDELIGKKYMDYVYYEDLPNTAKIAADISNGKEFTHFENRYTTKSGQIVPVLWSARWDSKVKIMYCVARDNTEKKLAEKKLSESEAFLQEAQRFAKMGSWKFDFKTDKLTWSDELYNVFDTDKDTFLETHGSFIHLVDESDRQHVLDTSKHTQETGEPFNIQYHITTARGEKRIIEEYGYGETDSEGNIIRLFGTAQDVTLRRQNEIALSLSEARFRGIIESQTNYLIRTDLQGNYTYCNQKFIDDFGWLYSNNELIGASGMVSIMPYHHQNVENTVKKCFSSPNQVFQVEIDKPAKNDRMKTTLWDFILLTDGDGHPAEIQCAGIDITDRKTAETQLQLLNENLQKQTNDLAISNAELEQFAFIASHDLQEPLRMVTSFLTQLEKKYYEQLDDKGKQYIHFAVDGAKRMRQIILDLLEYSRVGRLDSNNEKINTEEIIDDVRALYKSMIEESAAEIASNTLPIIHTDKSLLRQTFQNLIGNALKYQKKGVRPEISVSCEDRSDYWLFSVSDNGIGIDVEYFDHIFIIFKRLHNREEYPGTGMGLAITKKIVENMGGKIWVKSEKDKGSTFYFTIPKK